MKKVKVQYNWDEYVALIDVLSALHQLDLTGIKSFGAKCLLATLSRQYVKLMPKGILYKAKVSVHWETPEGYALLEFWTRYPQAFTNLDVFQKNTIRNTVATLDQAYA
jgi:hypothetical protein